MLHFGIFAQMLAKIGHAYVAATQTASYKPLLREAIIHGRTPLHFVGSDPAISPTAQEKSLHQIEQGPFGIAGVTYIIARIRLFASIPTPHYIVVVGEI
jgi:hypothetical protein